MNTESLNDHGNAPTQVIREMAQQLDFWRALLPGMLQWPDDSVLYLSEAAYTAVMDDEQLLLAEHGGLASTLAGQRNNLDIMTAQIRTRFYYARFTLYRASVYKALHFPELMTMEDADFFVFAIKSACVCPIAVAPPKDKKRLVPHLFTWMQTFFGILLIFKAIDRSEVLRHICAERVNANTIHVTRALLLEWMRDVKQLDGIAEWSWRLL